MITVCVISIIFCTLLNWLKNVDSCNQSASHGLSSRFRRTRLRRDGEMNFSCISETLHFVSFETGPVFPGLGNQHCHVETANRRTHNTPTEPWPSNTFGLTWKPDLSLTELFLTSLLRLSPLHLWTTSARTIFTAYANLGVWLPCPDWSQLWRRGRCVTAIQSVGLLLTRICRCNRCQS